MTLLPAPLSPADQFRSYSLMDVAFWDFGKTKGRRHDPLHLEGLC